MDIEVIKAKIAEFKAKGCEVPDMDMIKTPEQIEASVRQPRLTMPALI